MRSKLLNITVGNLGCIGNEGLSVSLDNILCLVGDNNSGKSTILKAYELALGTQSYSYEKDYCKRSKGENTYVEISVHIPEGTANIAEKWKEKKGELLVVKSKWEWDQNGTKTRKTFDPEIQDYSDDGNAAGLDNVFNSRLPVPFRIGALENPQVELKNLLKLIVDPIAENLRLNLDDKESELCKALEVFTAHAKKPVEEHKEIIEKINQRITNSHNKIFPNLSIDLNIGMADLKVDPLDALVKGSKLNIKEFEDNIDWDQQGTGSQRALFWSLLQVRSRLQAVKNFKSDHEKRVKQIEKDIKKLEAEKEKAKTETKKQEKQTAIDEKQNELKLAQEVEAEKAIDERNSELALPGYMLLIDEPEIALHPNGIRAASKYLYELANDPSWQVMLTTHSPLFINPFEDHTTIVRLSRSEGNPTPKTYRSDDIAFSEEEIDNLKLLNGFDQNLSEMFFGQYPIIIEGDTEYAAFDTIMRMQPEKYHINCKPILIRARGKYTIIPLIKMLTHFKVDFSVLHDSDFPKNKNGNANSAWSGNENIYTAIINTRNSGLRVVHRVSISTFEVAHNGIGLDEKGNYISGSSKDKPWLMYQKLKSNDTTRQSVEKVLDDLIDCNCIEEPFETDFTSGLSEKFKSWVMENNITDLRFLM
ncbi:ATP-dependent nuclease [Parafilimonas terrae]|uniref:AAA domain-containing protein n=1 Tax=Parafilimonas terrae TaxID=1465490 RepID=A0A1I5XFT6_9BACT|nr:AAA family ATPase [Parafilimonas terrae]SFQ30833.1 AAA domain-containing protein [Parafilimonas terrae]